MRPAAHRLSQSALLLGVFVLDRATKAWAIHWLAPRVAVPVLPFFHLTYLETTGAAWGMMRGSNLLLIAVSVALLGALFTMRRRWEPGNLWAHYGIALVAGGALGNLFDRIAYGSVVDFLDFLVWPVFNVADSAITVGAALIILDNLLELDRARAKKKLTNS